MYFSDFLQYQYCLSKPISNISMVGWLDIHYPFSTGRVDSSFAEKLSRIIIGTPTYNAQFNRSRGVHPCGFCKRCDIEISYEGRNELLGMSEVLVPDPINNRYFATPSLLYHYVLEHNYSPPRDFIEAVNAVDLSMTFDAEHLFCSIRDSN